MRQEEFRKRLEQPYLFHLHTVITDGKLNIRDYFEFAQKNGIKTIFFTEHVRRELEYDFREFSAAIRQTAGEYEEIRGVVGAEAKLLPGGGLDISRVTYAQLEVLCFACHGFPDDHELYFDSFSKLFSDPQWKDVARIFVHPGRYLRKRQVTDQKLWERLNELLLFAVSEGVNIEENKREMLPPDITIVPENVRVTGFDIHERTGLEKWKNSELNA
jgi:putative hydrolase